MRVLSFGSVSSVIMRLKQVRGLVSAAPSFTTGIEHAEELKKRGKKEKVDPKTYKVQEYLNFSKWTFYDKELELGPFRNPQPSKYKPDKLPHV